MFLTHYVKGILKVHICPNSKENIFAIHIILNNGGYLLEEFVDDGCIIRFNEKSYEYAFCIKKGRCFSN